MQSCRCSISVVYLLCPIVPRQLHPARDIARTVSAPAGCCKGNHTSCVYSRQGEYETARWNLQPNLNYSWTLAGQTPPLLKPLGANAHLRPSRGRITEHGRSLSGDDFEAGPRNSTSTALHIKVTQPMWRTCIYELMAGAEFLTVHLMLNNLNYIMKTLIHLGLSWLRREAIASPKSRREGWVN